jgi:hypothetical protein
MKKITYNVLLLILMIFATIISWYINLICTGFCKYDVLLMNFWISVVYIIMLIIYVVISNIKFSVIIVAYWMLYFIKAVIDIIFVETNEVYNVFIYFFLQPPIYGITYITNKISHNNSYKIYNIIIISSSLIILYIYIYRFNKAKKIKNLLC